MSVAERTYLGLELNSSNEFVVRNYKQIPLLFRTIPPREFDTFFAINIRLRQAAFVQEFTDQVNEAVHLGTPGDGRAGASIFAAGK
jgi:hypothetical protein